MMQLQLCKLYSTIVAVNETDNIVFQGEDYLKKITQLTMKRMRSSSGNMVLRTSAKVLRTAGIHRAIGGGGGGG